MTKDETYAFLKKAGAPFEAIEHKAVFTVEQSEALNLPHPEAKAKNIFLKCGKQGWCLVTLGADKRLDTKAFKKAHGFKSVSFASPEDLMAKLSLIPGEVTPLGLLNTDDTSIALFIDEAFLGGLISVHPNDNSASVFLKTSDLVRLIKKHGNAVSFFKAP